MHVGLVLISSLMLLVGCSSGGQKKTEAPASPAPVKIEEKTTKETPKKEASSGAGSVKCSVAGDERLLEVRAQGKGCELAYTKGGSEGIVATSANGSQHCESVQKKIKERLSGAGFSCN